MKAFFSFTASIALLCTGASAFADSLFITSARHIPPRQVVGNVAIQSTGSIEWYTFPKGRDSVQNVAQTFTAPIFKETSLNGVALRIAHGRGAVGRGAEHAPVTVSLYSSDDPENASKKNRLYSKTDRLPRRMQSGEYLVFDFGKNIKLKKGKRYTVTFEFESARPGQSLALAAGNQRSYMTGCAYLYTQGRNQKSPRWQATRENLSLVLLGR